MPRLTYLVLGDRDLDCTGDTDCTQIDCLGTNKSSRHGYT